MNRTARIPHAGVRLALIAIGAVFIFTAVVKLSDIDAFQSTILAQGVVPESLGTPAAWSVALVELGAGVLTILLVLLRPNRASAASVAPAALLVTFAAYALVLRVHPPRNTSFVRVRLCQCPCRGLGRSRAPERRNRSGRCLAPAPGGPYVCHATRVAVR